MLNNKIIFIAGGAGTLGNELTTQLLSLGVKEIRIFSRGEISQVSMKRKFDNDRVKFIIGDVRDFDAIMYYMQGSDYVFNLAALKHVGICEEQPQEAIRTNVDGTINLIRASIQLKVKKFIMASTDKAIYPSNLYGMTKGLCERLVIQANALTSNTDFICIRSGNILGSSGSVLPMFIDSVKTKNKVMVTDGKMTRFFLPVKEVAKLMISAIEFGHGGEVFVPGMPSFYIKDLAKIIADHYGDANTEIIEIGARAGEKTHELLVSPHEAPFTYRWGEYFVILPSININRKPIEFESKDKVSFAQLSSSSKLENRKYLYNMLSENGFLTGNVVKPLEVKQLVIQTPEIIKVAEKKVKFLIPIPDTDYYLAQILIQNNNFEKYGYDVDTHYLIGICYGTLNPKVTKIIESGKLKCNIHVYKDERELKQYSASLKPFLAYKYFQEFPEERDFYYCYFDPDCIFLDKFNFEPFMDGKNWYGSDTSSYMNVAYFRQKGEGFLEEMCNHCDIPLETVIANDKGIIGAHYITLNNTAEFWERVYKKSSETYIWLNSIQSKYFKPEMTYWFQIWTTEMWITIWELWKDGIKTIPHEDWQFHWASSVFKDKKHKILHLAGIVTQNQAESVHYAKRAYEHQSPFNKDFSMISPDSLTNLYIDEIKEVAAKYPELIW